jgi:hypothetical protein
MSLDIREGDILVVDAKNYQIRFCGDWKYGPGSTASMRRMCSITASTLRPPATSGSVRGNPSTNLTGVKCTPLDPASDNDLAIRNLTGAPYELLRTIVNGGDTFYELYVEKIRKA